MKLCRRLQSVCWFSHDNKEFVLSLNKQNNQSIRIIKKMAAAPRGRWVSTHSTRAGERAHLTEQQPTLMSEPPPVLFLLCEVKMSAVKRVYHCNRQLCTRESHMKYFCLKPEELLITVFFIFKNQICHKPCFCFCWLSWWWLTPSTFHPGIALLASVCFSPSVHFVFTVGDEHSNVYFPAFNLFHLPLQETVKNSALFIWI